LPSYAWDSGAVLGDFKGEAAGIESDPGDTDRPRTILRGQVRDQAELRGVLDALYGLHLAVIKVEQCSGE